MLYVIDSVYTDPDAIQKLYRNRKAIADMLPGTDPSDFGLTGGAASIVGTVTSSGGVSGGVGGGGDGGDRGGGGGGKVPPVDDLQLVQ